MSPESAETEQALLSVWNPLYEPATVLTHVDALLRCVAEGRPPRVSWGRIYEGKARTPEEIRDKWPRVFALAHAAQQAGQPFRMLLTDFASLHVARVRSLRPGWEGPPEDILPYYRGKQVVFWFEVEDVWNLSHDRLTTLDRFREVMTPGRHGTPHLFDPYAHGERVFPELVTVKRGWLDPADPLPPGTSLYAQLRQTVHPPLIAQATGLLSERMGPLWPRLSPESQVFLATARVVLDQMRSVPDADAAPALLGVAKAVECELVNGLLEPGLRTGVLRKDEKFTGQVTLGSYFVASRVVDRSLQRVLKVGHPEGVFKALVQHRNDGLHKGRVSHETVEHITAEVEHPDRSPLRAILDAADEMAHYIRTVVRRG